LSIQDVIKAVKTNKQDRGGWIILENGYEQIVQAIAYAKISEDLGNIMIKTRNGNPLKILDMAVINF